MPTTEFIHALPKTELHLHLEGAVAAPTVMDFARRHGIGLADFGDGSSLYEFADLAEFLRVYDIVCRSIREPDDFRRVTYEALERCARSNVRYVEFFFSPQAHAGSGIRYGAMLDGITTGMADAARDLGIVSRLIPAHNRELGPAAGMEFLQMVLGDRRDEIIGIGLDYLEAGFPPGPYAAMYAAARKAGLRTTAHAGESGPAQNIRDSLDLLGCDRIDHGYHIVDAPALLARCRDAGVGLTVCPSTTRHTTIWRQIDAPDHPIRLMAEAGLQVVVNTDDPGLFRTDLDAEYGLLARHMGWDARRLADCALRGIAVSWLDESTKKSWLAAWRSETDALLAGLPA